MAKNSRTKKRTDSSFQRKSNCRDERVVTIDKDKITFSFKDFISDQPKGNIQSFESWQEDKILSKLLDKLKHLSQLTIHEAIIRLGNFRNLFIFLLQNYICKKRAEHYWNFHG